MKLMDRAFQRRLLTTLAERYPSLTEPDELDIADESPEMLLFNLAYLHEHGLVQNRTADTLAEDVFIMDTRITARGLDFLQDDGGLSAVLNVVTVRLESNTLKALIEARLETADAPPEAKSRIKAALQHAGEETLAEIAKRLMETGLNCGPQAIDMLQKLLG